MKMMMMMVMMMVMMATLMIDKGELPQELRKRGRQGRAFKDKGEALQKLQKTQIVIPEHLFWPDLICKWVGELDWTSPADVSSPWG